MCERYDFSWMHNKLNWIDKFIYRLNEHITNSYIDEQYVKPHKYTTYEYILFMVFTCSADASPLSGELVRPPTSRNILDPDDPELLIFA